MFFDCGGAWQLRAGSCPERLDVLGRVDFDLQLFCVSEKSMPISARSSIPAGRPRLVQLEAAVVLGLTVLGA